MTYQPGIITTLAGTGARGYAGDGGAAASALMSEPFMCAFDAAGNLYVAEAMNHCIRRVDSATGVITTIAGTGAEGYSGDGGPATAATFNQPYSLQVDGNDDVYVVDRLNYVITQDRRGHRRHHNRCGHRRASLRRRWQSGGGGQVPRAQRLFPRRPGRTAHCRRAGPAHSPPRPGIGHHHHLRGQRRKGAPRRRPARYGGQHLGRAGRLHGRRGQHLHRRARGQRHPQGGCQRHNVHAGRNGRVRLLRRRRPCNRGNVGAGRRPSAATTRATCWWWTPRTTPSAASTRPRASSLPSPEGGWVVAAMAARRTRRQWTGPTAATWTPQATYTSPTATTTACGWWGCSGQPCRGNPCGCPAGGSHSPNARNIQ